MNQDKYDADLSAYNWLAREVDRHESWQALELSKLLCDKLNPKSIIDIGCSSGIYMVYPRSIGCSVYGIDGASGVGKWLQAGEFEVVDLRNPWNPPKGFDLAICIETGEHIRPEFHEILVETISKCSKNVFWSAAPPGQGGEGHVGEIPKQEWIKLFGYYGYTIHPLSDEITNIINTDDPYGHCNWLRSNAILFTRD